MIDLNPKILLNELFQKNKMSNPTYYAKRIGGTDHTPLYSSTIIINKNVVIEGEYKNNKKYAEKSASFNTYKYNNNNKGSDFDNVAIVNNVVAQKKIDVVC